MPFRAFAQLDRISAHIFQSEEKDKLSIDDNKSRFVTYRNEEVWFQRMEEYSLNVALHLLERCLRVSSCYLMDPNTSFVRPS